MAKLNVRHLALLILIVSFWVTPSPVCAQQVIANVAVGVKPYSVAINPVTNRIYVSNACGTDPACAYPYSRGTLTVIDGVSNNIISVVNVGFFPDAVGINSLTNVIYVVNSCGNDRNCVKAGTVTVIDGVTNNIKATVSVETSPYGAAVNPVTNKIYVANVCGTDLTCSTYSGTVSVIDGATLTTSDVAVGADPYAPVVDPVANKIYVPNACGNDATCHYPYSPGSVTVIDGATNNPVSVAVGVAPYALDVNPATNKIYVANQCGDDPNCAGTATLTVIDGATLGATNVPIGGFYPFAIAVNPVTNKIYVPTNCFGDVSCQGEPNGAAVVIDGATLSTSYVAAGNAPIFVAVNSATNKIYVANSCGTDPACKNHNSTVTVIDGATLARASITVGADTYTMAINSVTNRVYATNLCGNDASCQTHNGTVSVIDGTPPTALQFVPLPQPCRAVDTRPDHGGSGPVQGGTHQDFALSGAGSCAVLDSAAAYSLNLSVVPQGPLGYLTVWPTGQVQPLASTLNSLDGRIKANAAIVPAGSSGKISVYAASTTNVIVDVNGYFAPVSSSTLAFYPLPPCRVADTRDRSLPHGLGQPYVTGGTERAFPILNSTTCHIPAGAAAYSLNFSVVPHGPLFYMTVWPTGQTRPVVSTLNDIPGTIIANAAIVVAGTGGAVSAFPTDDTDVIIDINGYFAAATPAGMSLYDVSPCRILDTRKLGRGQPFNGLLTPAADVVDMGCAASSTAQAYVFNASVVPYGALGYLTLWPDGDSQPLVSTLNALDASISSNMAIVPSTNGNVDAYASGLTQLILDISGYFAP